MLRAASSGSQVLCLQISKQFSDFTVYRVLFMYAALMYLFVDKMAAAACLKLLSERSPPLYHLMIMLPQPSLMLILRT
ncbi:hypothetical protein ACJW30_05G160600 [Castanea mollissima]